MTVRTRKEIVSFDRPFALNGLDGFRPAGSYEVETDEQLVEGVSFPAYRRLATWIRLPTKPGHPGVTEILNVDPKELDAAQIRDAAPAAKPGDGNSARRTSKTTTKSRDEKADLAAEERSEDDGMKEHARKAADPAAWAADRGARTTSAGAGVGPVSHPRTEPIVIETGSSARPNPPWQADSERPPAEAPPPAIAKERTVFGLAGDLKKLVREDRMQRSDHAHRFNQRKILSKERA